MSPLSDDQARDAARQARLHVQRGRLLEAIVIAKKVDTGQWTCQPGDMRLILQVLRDYQALLDA